MPSQSYYEGIPVIVADRYDPPFAHIVDYSKFSVRVAQSDIKQLDTILKEFSEHDRDMMRIHGKSMVSIFRYGVYDLQPGLDASPMIAFQLWAYANEHQTELDEDWSQRDTYIKL